MIDARLARVFVTCAAALLFSGYATQAQFPSRADLATVFHVKNVTCLGTGKHISYTSKHVGEAILDEKFSIEYISRSLLPLSAYAGCIRLDVDYEPCCSHDFAWNDELDYKCWLRCVVVRTGSDKLEFMDEIGSRSESPFTQVTRRLVLLKDHNQIAVWVDGVPLQATRSTIIEIPKCPRIHDRIGKIVVQGTGCVSELIVSSHWLSNRTLFPLDIRKNASYAKHRYWNWYPSRKVIKFNSATQRIIFLSPLPNQIYTSSEDIVVRWAVTAGLDFLYNHNTRQCLSIHDAKGNNIEKHKPMFYRCIPASSAGESLYLNVDDIPTTSDLLRFEVSIITHEQRIVASSDIEVVIKRADRLREALNSYPYSYLSQVGPFSNLKSIGLGPGVPPFIVNMTMRNMTVPWLNEKLKGWIVDYNRQNHVETKLTDKCEVLYATSSPFVSIVPLSTMLNSLDNNINLHRFLSQLTTDQLTVSPYCGLPGDNSLGLWPKRLDIIDSPDEHISNMPCIESGTSNRRGKPICFPVIPKNDPQVSASMRWEWKWLLEPTARTKSNSTSLIGESSLICKRTTMSHENIATCRCQRCAARSNSISRQLGISTPSAQLLTFSNDKCLKVKGLPADMNDIGCRQRLLISMNRHARIFSSNIQDKQLLSSTNRDGAVMIRHRPLKNAFCDRRRISNIPVHLSAIGTGLNIYHLIFDLVYPIFQTQMKYYHRLRNDSVVVLTIGNTDAAGTDILIRLAQWYDLPMSTLLSEVCHVIVSRESFDQVIFEKDQPLCLDDVWVGQKQDGFLELDFHEQDLRSTSTPTSITVKSYRKKQRRFNRFMVSAMLRRKNGLHGSAAIPSRKDGLLFILRDHNRRLNNIEELIAVTKNRAKKHDIITLHPHRVQFRQLISLLQSPRISIGVGITGAGFTNFMFMRNGAVAIFVALPGLTGFAHHSFGHLLPASGVHFIALCLKTLGPHISEGWSGAEDEETRLTKDADVRVDPKQFLRALHLADELLEQNLLFDQEELKSQVGRWEIVYPEKKRT